ncbi:hypothetical protein FB446DRAFT_211814 [Lentinula raphanica]|nr:hypothetical protein FB446DRAFT_211814 [Lentinula raphanica]
MLGRPRLVRISRTLFFFFGVCALPADRRSVRTLRERYIRVAKEQGFEPNANWNVQAHLHTKNPPAMKNSSTIIVGWLPPDFDDTADIKTWRIVRDHPLVVPTGSTVNWVKTENLLFSEILNNHDVLRLDVEGTMVTIIYDHSTCSFERAAPSSVKNVYFRLDTKGMDENKQTAWASVELGK